MKILVDRLDTTPEHFSFRAEEGWWQRRVPSGDPGGTLLEPFEIGVDAHLMGEDLFLQGRVEGALELECARCLARYRHALQESFELVAEPAGSRVPADPEAAQALARDGLCLGDELSLGWYQDRGVEIHLDALCFEVISLSMPVKPLCREDCAGLCARCGAELDRGPCGCDEVQPTSPFAVLAALRDDSEGAH